MVTQRCVNLNIINDHRWFEKHPRLGILREPLIVDNLGDYKIDTLYVTSVVTIYVSIAQSWTRGVKKSTAPSSGINMYYLLWLTFSV